MASGVELAKAYVQILPTTKGIKGSIGEVLEPEANDSGKKAGLTIGSKIKSAILVAGIGKALQSVISEGAKLEQSIGGIETLFKNSADLVKRYANNAYESAGLSANEYMEQVTSFSASLLQSLGGNTEKAARSANQAIIDMADNSNKMGTSMESIQNAYQGFAKQNYTMLDNLKLGYGGTKSEMERLLKDATKLSGVKYDIKNLDDVYQAIHVIQENLGITGTTALEAKETISGSFNAMKSSFINLLGAMATGNTDITEKVIALADTAFVFIHDNLFPMIRQTLSSIPEILLTVGELFVYEGMDWLVKLSEGFVTGFPNLMKSVLDMMQNLGDWLSEQAPVIIQKGFEMLSNLVQGILNALPVMIQQLPQIITTYANIINDNFPTIFMKGAELLLQFIKGILSAIPTLIANIPQIIQAIVSLIMAFQWLNLGKNIMNFFGNGIKSMKEWIKTIGKEIYDGVLKFLKDIPKNLLNLGKTMIQNFGKSIVNTTGTVSGAIKGIEKAVINGLKSLPSQMVDIGKNLIKGLWNGISDMVGWIGNKIKGFGNSILNGLKDFFGIHSPSRVFNEEIGKMLPLGMAEGIENNINPVKTAMNQLAKETIGVIDTDIDVSSSNLASIQSNNINALETIIYLLKLLVNKDEHGEFVFKIGDREFVRLLKEMGVVFE